ncbi:carbon storage regulator [Microbulbifer sp. JMSA002]
MLTIIRRIGENLRIGAYVSVKLTEVKENQIKRFIHAPQIPLHPP